MTKEDININISLQNLKKINSKYNDKYVEKKRKYKYY